MAFGAQATKSLFRWRRRFQRLFELRSRRAGLSRQDGLFPNYAFDRRTQIIGPRQPKFAKGYL